MRGGGSGRGVLKRDEGLGGGSGLVGVKGAWRGVEVWLQRRVHLSQGFLRLISIVRGGSTAESCRISAGGDDGD